jgi:hypothetical protein
VSCEALNYKCVCVRQEDDCFCELSAVERQIRKATVPINGKMLSAKRFEAVNIKDGMVHVGSPCLVPGDGDHVRTRSIECLVIMERFIYCDACV